MQILTQMDTALSLSRANHIHVVQILGHDRFPNLSSVRVDQEKVSVALKGRQLNQPGVAARPCECLIERTDIWGITGAIIGGVDPEGRGL